MKVLVTGGSGFVGRETVRQLVAAGHAVRVLARGTKAAAAPPAGVEPARGSILEPATLPAAVAGCDAVIHLVGIIAELGPQTYEQVHTAGTQNVLAAARTAGVPRWLHMSALGTRPAAVARYHRSKWLAEEAVRASGLAWTIFRPSVVFGPGDGFVNLFARLSRWSPVLPVVGRPDALLQPVAVADVARCFVTALGQPAAAGRAYDVCGRERFTLAQVLAEIGAATGRKRWHLRVPPALARAQAGFLEWFFPAVLRQAPPLNRDQLLMLAEDNVGDPAALIRDFGFEPSPFRAGIREYVR
jgi:uncharacterized protein YbjT (DUF2867 family)